MIPEKSNNSVQVSAAFHTKQFGIDNEDFSHLVDLIQNQLYSDKPLALIREYSCNAYDANVVAGRKDTPIKISLPSLFSSQLVIRDYGNGLSQSDMENIFTRYGKSTKRNDNVTVGCFGIGSKAAFSYTPSFMVNSYQKGLVTSYNCVLDESNVGKLILLGEDATTEADGLEVIINVQKDDVENFRQICLRFFRHWDVMPVIEGFSEDDYATMRGIEKVVLSGTGWKITNVDGYQYSRRVNTTAIMGNIGYPVAWNSVKGFAEMLKARDAQNHYNLQQFITNNNVLFDFGIGEVKMSPSRETLQYTELTNNALVKRVETVLNEVAQQAQAKIDSATNLWEAKMMFDEMFSNLGCLNCLRNSIVVKYKGIEIKSNRITGFDKLPTTVLKTYNRRNGNTNFYGYDCGKYDWNSIECANKKMILEIDQTDKVYIQKAVNYLNSLNGVTTVYVLNFKDAAERALVFASTGLDDVFITKYSTIADAVKDTIVRKTSGGANISVKKDSTVRSLRYVNQDMTRGWYYRTLRDLNTEDVDMVNGGIYVETNNNDVIDDTISDIIERVNVVSRINNKQPLTVYFIGQNLVGGKLMAKGAWVKFSDYISDKVKAVASANPDLGKLLALDALKDSGEVISIDDSFVEFIKDNSTKVNSDLVALVEFISTKKADELYLTRQVVTATDDDKKAVKAMFDAVTTKYPLFRVINNGFCNTNDMDEKEILAYLK
jgi:hypothetical protein